MLKKPLVFALILILTVTALPYNDSAFSNYTFAENKTDDNSSVTEGAVSGESIDDILFLTEENTDKINITEDTDVTTPGPVETTTPEPVTVTTPEPIRNTKLITNPYKGYSYSRLIKEINKLQEQYYDIISTEYIGTTAGGRDIPLVKLGTGEKKILIIGSEHAREYVSTSLIMRSIDTYSQAYVQNKKIDGTSVRNVLDKVTFYFVPMLNIDGVQLVLGTASSKDKKTVKKYVGSRHYTFYKNNWKSNIRGVDLNRNYPFRWSKGSKIKRRSYMGFKGRKQASEPEVKSIVKLCKNNQFAFMFTMHTRGQVIYWKDKYNSTVPEASKLAKKVKSITKYRLMPTSSWASCAGESAKWFRYVYNKPAFTIELTPNNLAYKKATKGFDKYVWKKNKSLFLRTALSTKPTDKYKVFLSAGKGKVSKRYINIKTGKTYGSLPKAKRRGFKFLGWYTAGGKKIDSDDIASQTQNTWLYAKYKKK